MRQMFAVDLVMLSLLAGCISAPVVKKDVVSPVVSVSKESAKIRIPQYQMIEGALIDGCTLKESLKKSGVPGSLIDTVSAVLLCRISFKDESAVGDQFAVMIRKEVDGAVSIPAVFYSGKYAGYHEAFSFRDIDSCSAFNAHYTPAGEGLIHSSFRYPVNSINITSGFGMRTHPVTGVWQLHNGVDYSGSIGDPVYSVSGGVVTAASFDETNGNRVVIEHDDKTSTHYLHLDAILVKPGQRVGVQQEIGRLGGTGVTTGPHLHFSIKNEFGEWVDPLNLRMIAASQLEGFRLSLLRSQIDFYRYKISEITEPKSPIQYVLKFPQYEKFCKGG